MNNFAVLTIAYSHTATSIIITITTNNPCHLTCYYTDKKPLKHHTTRIVRGLEVPWGVYFCFVAWKAVEQNEPGDTLYHTFTIPEWSYCQTKWFTFRGTVDEVLSPSVGPIFMHHHHYTTFYEAQLLHNASTACYGGRHRAGQRLIIPGRQLTKLAFMLWQYVPGATGPVTFEVWDITLPGPPVASKVWGDAALLPAYPDWREVTFDDPVFVSGHAIICIYYPGPGYVGIRYQNTDVKPDEYYAQQVSPGFAWEYILTNDMTYQYVHLT